MTDRPAPFARDLTPVTINVNGIKVQGRSLTLGHLLHEHYINICVATETHLRQEEVDNFDLDN